MTHEIPLYGGRLVTEIVTDLQIHIYLGKDLTFTNTIIMESRKLIAPNISVVIHEHPHPQNAIGTCPFAIINGKAVKQKEDIYKVLRMLIEVSEKARNAANPAENEADPSNQADFLLTALLQMCQQLSEVATVLNEDDLNPFYVFLNPILKYREYRKSQQLKNRVHLRSQFLTKSQTLNTDYFLYKLNILGDYVKQLARKRLSIVQRKFVKICIIGLLKHFNANSKPLLSATLQHEEFQKIHSRTIQQLTELTQYYEKLVQEKREAIGAYATFDLQDKPQQKQPEELHETFRQRLTQSLIKPAAVTMVFLTIYTIFSN